MTYIALRLHRVLNWEVFFYIDTHIITITEIVRSVFTTNRTNEPNIISGSHTKKLAKGMLY